jgi:hypothetical protein
MTNTKKILYLTFVLFILVCAIAAPVYADHGRGHGYVRGGIWLGPLWWGPWWEPYPYYASPPVVIQQQAPIYEQPAPQPEQLQYYWYFCADSRAYYPYVKECPGGWMKVVPAPASPKGRE